MAPTNKPTDIKPPFDEEKAKLKVKAAENAWNTCNPELVAQAYTEDSKWRNRTEFLIGREVLLHVVYYFRTTTWKSAFSTKSPMGLPCTASTLTKTSAGPGFTKFRACFPVPVLLNCLKQIFIVNGCPWSVSAFWILYV